MRKIAISLLGVLIVGCASISGTQKYDSQEFSTENYQKRIDLAISSTDSLPDFANLGEINSDINSTDLSLLVRADVAFNQGDYLNALPLYEKFSYQYKNPKIIYKAILCYERSGLSNQAPDKVNKLIDLFIQVAPNTNIALLLEVKESLYKNDIVSAQDRLNRLLKKDPDNARTYLLFLSAVISINNGFATTGVDTDKLNQFAKFVTDKYGEYPEAYLLGAILYAINNNIEDLGNILNTLNATYPEWQLPMIWSASILSSNNHYDSIIMLTKPYVVGVKEPNWVVENIYIGALVNNKQSDIAIAILKQQQQAGFDNPNIYLNLGIIYAKNRDYKTASAYLAKVNLNSVAMTNLINLYLGLLYDIESQHSLAIIYYQKVTGNVFLENIADTLLVTDYLSVGSKDQAEVVLSKIAKDKNLSGVNEVLFKASYYLGTENYADAYNLLKSNYLQYKANKDYIYLYASSLAMTKHTSDAIKMYKYYIKLNPDSANGYNDLAYVYIEQTKNYALGIRYAKQAAKRNITDYNVLDTLGWSYYKLGDYTTAYPLVYSSYQQMPTNEGAKHLREILVALHKPDLAKQVPDIDKTVGLSNINKLLADRIFSLIILLQYGATSNLSMVNSRLDNN